MRRLFQAYGLPNAAHPHSDHPEAQSIPVIAMTANVFVKDVHDALDAGMNAHIAKPLNLETLKSTLGSCLPKKQNS